MKTQKRSHIWHWFLDHKIQPQQFNAAMLLAYPHPSAAQWQQLIANIVLYLGVLLVGAGVIFFMAFNWDALSHLSKFAIVEIIFSLFIAGFYLANRRQTIHEKAHHSQIIHTQAVPDSTSDLLDVQHAPSSQYNHSANNSSHSSNNKFGWSLPNAMLLGASIMLGALLALVGQTYQTGADPWQLFAIWAVLILPFAYIAGFDLLWLLIAVLLNVSLGLYLQSFASIFDFLLEDIQQIAVYSLVNLAIHLLFSVANRCQWRGQSRFNGPIVEASSLFAGVSGLTWLIIWVIFDLNYNQDTSKYAVNYALLYLVTLSCVFAWYRYRAPALYPLTMVLTSISAAIIALLSKASFESNDPVGIFFLIAMVVVGLTSGSLYLLKKWQKEFSDMAILKDEQSSNNDANSEGTAHE